jgi:3-hydroxyacyl-[acyl-carrier-protein] dehydratase
VRFLFYDRILELVPARRIVATKAISIGDEFLHDHYSRSPLMPATLVLESLAQVAGWLYMITEDFTIHAILVMFEGAEVKRHPRPGDTLILDVSLEFRHQGGATLRGVARDSAGVFVQVARMVFGSMQLTDPRDVTRARELFSYLSGGFVLNGASG